MYLVSVAFRTTWVSSVGSEQQQGRCFISSAAQLPRQAQGLPSVLPGTRAARCASRGFMVPLRLFLDVKSILEKYCQFFFSSTNAGEV